MRGEVQDRLERGPIRRQMRLQELEIMGLCPMPPLTFPVRVAQIEMGLQQVDPLLCAHKKPAVIGVIPYLLHRSFERQSAVIAHSTL